MADAEKTAAEIQAEERELAIKRGDIIEDEADETVEASDEGLDESEPAAAEAEDDEGDPKLEADDEESGEEVGDPEGESDDADASAAQEDDPKDIKIPKARFDEAQKKARDRIAELEAKLSKAEKEHAQAATDADVEKLQGEITSLEDQWAEYLMEGETDKVKATRREIDQKREELIQTRLVQQSQATGNAAVEQIRYETKLAVIEEKYPALNPDSTDYDPALENEVGEMKAAFEARGWGSTAALEKAIHYVIRDVEAPPSEDPEIKRSQRAHKARKAAAAAAKATPPDASLAGRDSDKGGKGDGLPDVTKMTPDQFAKWAESDPDAMAKLRGDTLTADEAAA